MADEVEFEVGDVVNVKGSSPKMTVESIRVGDQYSTIHCVWFDVENRLQRGCFPSLVLEASE